jgi:hypothetical protein
MTHRVILSFLLATGVLLGQTTVPQTRLNDATKELREVFPEYLQSFGANPFIYEEWGEFKPAPASIDQAFVDRVLDVASTWAREHGYLPCGFPMAGRVLVGVDQPDLVLVYIAETTTPKPGSRGGVAVALVLTRPGLQVMESIRHGGRCVTKEKTRDDATKAPSNTPLNLSPGPRTALAYNRNA